MKWLPHKFKVLANINSHYKLYRIHEIKNSNQQLNNGMQTREIYMSHRIGKPTFCIGENKGADQLRSNCEADQRLCFRYTDSTIPLLSKSKISSLYTSSVTVQPYLCQTRLETTLLDFPRGGSYIYLMWPAMNGKREQC